MPSKAVVQESAIVAGFSGRAGHRSVGGIRAFLYNGMQVAAVEKLAGSGRIQAALIERRLQSVASVYASSAMTKVLFIRAEWDSEAEVWVATSDDVPGLATEADTLEALSTKLDSLVPELLDANGYPDGPEVPFELLARRFSVAHRKAA